MLPEYFSPLDHSGRRVDLGNRPELSHGTVDIIVPQEYWAPLPPPSILPSFTEETLPPHDHGTTRTPIPLRTLFVIDVSVCALASNVTRDACEAIRGIVVETRLECTSALERSIGIMTFDSSLHLYDLTVSRAASKTHLTTNDEISQARISRAWSCSQTWMMYLLLCRTGHLFLSQNQSKPAFLFGKFGLRQLIA